MMEQERKHRSRIHTRHPNSKFASGSRAWIERAKKLALIRERMMYGRSFGDIQLATAAVTE